jgi:transposase
MRWKALAEEQAARIEQLQQRIAELEAEVATLKKDSRTSSKPPSSDIVKPPKKRDRRRKRKIGGQKGHKRHVRQPFPDDQIDLVETITLEYCPKCNGTLTLTDTPPKIFQQVELVIRSLIITEYQQLHYWCEHCQKSHTAPLPFIVKKSGLFGVALIAKVAYLKGECGLSFQKIKKFFFDVFGVSVSTGFLTKLIQKASDALAKPYEELKAQLPKESHIHTDETGHKKNGELHWTWCFRALFFTLFHIDSSRGSVVLFNLLGEDFDGKISCDFWGAYKKFSGLTNAVLLLCWAHLIREVKWLAEHKDPKVARYGKRLLAEIESMFKTIHRRGEIQDRTWFRRMAAHREAILKAARCRVPANNVALNLSVRLRDWEEEYFRFIETGLPPTNNFAEQSIRRVVLNRRITQGTRSDWGNRWWERIWSVLATCSQQGKNVMAFLKSAIEAMFHGLDPPKLLAK